CCGQGWEAQWTDCTVIDGKAQAYTQPCRYVVVKRLPFTLFHVVDNGDYVTVYNAEKVLFTGRKWIQKLYRWHTRYPGGLKEVQAKNMLKKYPDNLIRK